MHEGTMDDIRKAFFELIQEINKAFAPLVNQKIEIRNAIQNALISIKTNLPDMEQVYSRLEYSIQSNTKYGWCFSAGMDIAIYSSISDQEDKQETRDLLFEQYFEKNDMFHYKFEKAEIIKMIDPQWVDILNDCFFLIEHDRFKAAIPTLITAIEHEISLFLPQSIQFGKYLLKSVRSSFEANQYREELSPLVGISILKMLMNDFFCNHTFDLERKKLINRNWILHGRDNPNLWTKADVFRLMTLISALCFLRVD
jgi:hypothetical protein